MKVTADRSYREEQAVNKIIGLLAVALIALTAFAVPAASASAHARHQTPASYSRAEGVGIRSARTGKPLMRYHGGPDSVTGPWDIDLAYQPSLCIDSSGAGKPMTLETTCSAIDMTSHGTWNGNTSYLWSLVSTSRCIFANSSHEVVVSGHSGCSGNDSAYRWGVIYGKHAIEFVNVKYGYDMIVDGPDPGWKIRWGTSNGTYYHWIACGVKQCVTR